MGTDKQNGWNEYSRLVLTELEKLNKKVDDNTEDIHLLRQDLIKLESLKDEMSDVKVWKKKVDEVVSKIVGVPVMINDPRLIKLVVKWKRGSGGSADVATEDNFLSDPKKITELKKVFNG